MLLGFLAIWREVIKNELGYFTGTLVSCDDVVGPWLTFSKYSPTPSKFFFPRKCGGLKSLFPHCEIESLIIVPEIVSLDLKHVAVALALDEEGFTYRVHFSFLISNKGRAPKRTPPQTQLECNAYAFSIVRKSISKSREKSIYFNHNVGHIYKNATAASLPRRSASEVYGPNVERTSYGGKTPREGVDEPEFLLEGDSQKFRHRGAEIKWRKVRDSNPSGPFGPLVFETSALSRTLPTFRKLTREQNPTDQIGGFICGFHVDWKVSQISVPVVILVQFFCTSHLTGADRIPQFSSLGEFAFPFLIITYFYVVNLSATHHKFFLNPFPMAPQSFVKGPIGDFLFGVVSDTLACIPLRPGPFYGLHKTI
jgi:hypothetical protein